MIRVRSLSVVFQPRLTLSAALARPAGTPIASRTCEGPTLPDEQAEPDETAMPWRSSAMTAVSASKPSSAKQLVFGNR